MLDLQSVCVCAHYAFLPSPLKNTGQLLTVKVQSTEED